MSLKVKLTSTIAAFFLILGLLVMGVFATSQATVNLGGSLSFNATNVYANVTGRVIDATNETHLPPLTFKAGRTPTEETQHATDLSAWGNCDITFPSNGVVSILITIQNLAARPMYATIDTSESMSNKIDSSMLIVESEDATTGETYIGGTIALGNAETETDTVMVRLTMEVEDKNTSLSADSTWGYKIDLNNENPFPDAVGVMQSSHAITLDDTLSAGTYTLKYEDANGIMVDYADICSLQPGQSYTGFIKQNVAPLSTTTIGVYNSSDERVGSVGLKSTFKKDLGEKLYSFGAISDVHIGYNTSESDFQTALTYFGNDSSIEFIANCGDLATGGSDANLATYKSIVDQYAKTPVYAIAGNHEAGRGYLANDALMSYTGQNLYYSVTQGNDVYIMVGLYDVHPGLEFSDEELNWLYETLETNRDKRCFVFMHLNPRDGSGDAVDLDLGGDMLSNPKGQVFYSLMSHYTNVTWFHGHTHAKFNVQELNGVNTYDNVLGIHSVHVPSLTNPKHVNSAGTSYEADYDASEGYVVDVYENSIVLRGRDFVAGKFLPIASYCLDTTLDTIEEGTYYDSTQTIVNSNSNILKENDTWYESTMAKSEITKISIVKSYNPASYDEAWDASISENNQVMVYRTGTELTMVGNQYGIVANANSNNLFKDFSGLIEIIGFENLNTSNVASFKEVFRGCSKLTNIDISGLDLSRVSSVTGLFRDCSDLSSFKLPNNIGDKTNTVVVLSKMFESCSSLTEADLTNLSAGTITSCGEMFNSCSALQEVKFGKLAISSLSTAFYRCNKIQKIDMSEVDFSSCNTMKNSFAGCSNLSTLKLPTTMNTSKVKEFDKTFMNCSALTLDCSGWDITSCTIYTDFNTGAPGVTPPAFA